MHLEATVPTSSRIINDRTKEHFVTLLSKMDYEPITKLCAERDPNGAYDYFVNLITGAYNESFPKIVTNKQRYQTFHHPWMTKGLLKSCKVKSKLYLKYIKKPSQANKSKFTAYRNLFKTLKTKSIQNYYATEFTKYSNDIKKTWNTIRSIINSKPLDVGIETLSVDGHLITDKAAIAHHLNTYFTEVAENLRLKIPSINSNYSDYLVPPMVDSFVLYPTYPEELISLNHSMKLSHSSGPDLLDPSILSPNLSLIVAPLTQIFNCSLETGTVPDKMKLSTVTPIFKQGNKEDLGNYRPISILPYFSKLLEKVVYHRLNDYVTKKNIIFPSQHGFRSGHSTVLPLINIQDKISQAIDRKEFSVGIFLDLSKAFDTVDHDILIKKLHNYGIRGTPLLWFKDYLTHRFQQVKCNGFYSTFQLIKFGVPQGSILGPLLFILYINDLPNSSSLLEFVLFADDSNVFLSHSSYDDLIRLLNEELLNISRWFKVNMLSLNLNKTNYILFSSNRKACPNSLGTVIIDAKEIPQVSSVKFLGVYVDQHLTWKTHIEQISRKIAINIGIIKRISYILSPHILLTLYYTMIYPYLSYCNMVWASNYKSRLHGLAILQKKLFVL